MPSSEISTGNGLWPFWRGILWASLIVLPLTLLAHYRLGWTTDTWQYWAIVFPFAFVAGSFFTAVSMRKG